MKLPRQFFQPLTIGAPAPLRELPIRLERMIHFVPPHLEKLGAKVVNRLKRWVVMQAPTDQRFCVVRVQRPGFRKNANSWD